MGTLIDELERNTTIDIVKSALEFGCPVEVIIKILMHKLNLTKDEADQIYKTEVLGTATVQAKNLINNQAHLVNIT